MPFSYLGVLQVSSALDWRSGSMPGTCIGDVRMGRFCASFISNGMIDVSDFSFADGE